MQHLHMLLKAMMALATLLSSHQAAIATLNFFYKHRNDQTNLVQQAAYDLYALSNRIQCAIIDHKTEDGNILLTEIHFQKFRQECNDVKASLDTIKQTPNIPFQAPYPGMLPHAHPSYDGNPTHHEDIHSSIAATWRDIRSDLDGM